MRINFNSQLSTVTFFLRGIIPVLILLFTSLPGSESVIQVSAGVDKSVITIGDRITYTLTIAHHKDLHIEQPGPGANLGQFEIKDYKIYDPAAEKEIIRQRFDYQISVFDTGRFVIPPFPVAFAESDTSRNYQIIQSEPIEILVKSVLTAEDNDIRDIKPPQEIPVNYRRWILMGGALLLLIAAVLLTYYLIRLRKKGISLFRRETIRPAHEIALEELEKIKAVWQERLSGGEHKWLFTRISEILRLYLENRFFIQALEETTSEIRISLRELDLQNDEREKVLTVLEFSDLVKFAKYIPEEGEVFTKIEETESFILQTKLVFETVEHPVPVSGDSSEIPVTGGVNQ